MASRAERPATRRRLGWWGLLLLLVLSVAPLGGCSCRSESPAERAARAAKEEAERIAEEERRIEEERRSMPVVLAPARTLPASDGAATLFAKPGHWNVVQQPAKANANDFDGVVTYEVVGKDNASLAPPGTPLRLVSRRPLVVARESQKRVDALFYCPPIGDASPRLRSVITQRRSGERLPELTPALRPLADHQYHFVVFAKEPGRYAYVDALRSVTATIPANVDASAIDGADGRLDADKNYRVVAVPADAQPGEALLPDNALAWTSIAYVLWDEVDPDVLSPAQRDALVDWLNWGGQLVINGPDSLDLLRGGFLGPHLPATSEGTREIAPDELTAMEARWGVGQRGKPLVTKGPWSGVRLKPDHGGAWIPGLKGLAIERRVGRGRIVVTAMQLADRRLVAWSNGIENLFNAAILRRPARRFISFDNSAAFDDVEASAVAPAAVVWADTGEPRPDPLRNTGWRGFVRDTYKDPGRLALQLKSDLDATAPYGLDPDAEEFLKLQPAPVPGGAGASHDFGAVAGASRSVLSKSAGVSVPGAGFVIGCLAVYLFVLVPANWAFFTALRRTELAWAAAPVIALTAAWVVVQQAQLDIGFVRSRTEVAVLELQPDTPRALLTRFTALYTSLSTVYEMEFDSPAVAAPFPRTEPDRSRQFTAPATVAYERQEKSRLRDLAVSSATTEFVRSEEMFDVSASGVAGSSAPGAIRLSRGPSGAPRVENRTDWALEDVMVVGRPDGVDGAAVLEGCWLGDLGPGDMATIATLPIPEPAGDDLPFGAQRTAAAKLRGGDPGQRLDLDRLLRLALDPARYEPGERRVVARVSSVLPGLTITPSSSQKKGATLVVATLGYGPLPPPQPDVNGPQDVN